MPSKFQFVGIHYKAVGVYDLAVNVYLYQVSKCGVCLDGAFELEWKRYIAP